MKGIIFSAHSLPLVLNRTKRMTRRGIKVQSSPMTRANGEIRTAYMESEGYWYYRDESDYSDHDTQYRLLKPQPYKVGEVCYVKEAYCRKWDENTGYVYNSDGNRDSSCYHYEADGVEVRAVDGDGFQRWTKNGRAASPWKSPMMMPEVASRAKVKILSVKAERLSDISDEDCLKEGIKKHLDPFADMPEDVYLYESPTRKTWFDSARDAYRNYFEAANPKAKWGEQWVWVYEFELVEGGTI